MNAETKSAIHDLVLHLRHTLETEIQRELGRYGIYPDRAWRDPDDLPRLTDHERDFLRPRIEAAIHREQDAGLDCPAAVRAYIRETAYTHMNRLLGLKCLETRGLIPETVTTHPIYSDRSLRHRDYLDQHTEAHRQPDRGLVAMLQQAYTGISQHIGILFDPDSDYTLVWPRHTILKECIDVINALDTVPSPDPDAAPAPSPYADDTVLGWVYQYFQEKDKDRVFLEVYNQKAKIGGHDIIPATTAYTERYMVQFLVENSLGAFWMEMYPTSDLCDRWPYFVGDPNLQNDDGTRQQGREHRPVADLTLLDPACGSGHFLLYAFDLFAQMHEAEAAMHGQPMDRAAIARAILAHNLHGIDIDLRSVQLSALNLYMKACSYAGLSLDALQRHGPLHVNLVCADLVLRRGPEFDQLLARFQGDPRTQDLIRTIWRGLENARELGSLLKIEEQVDRLIQRKRKQEEGGFWERGDELWDLWKQNFLKAVQAVAAQTTDAFDINQRMFGNEATRGAQLLDLLAHHYAFVLTNPPYMGSWNMADELKEALRALYPRAWKDLYAAFIERCLGLAEPEGLFGLVSQQSFMFLPSYDKLRQWMTANSLSRTTAHLGPGAFADISGEKVNTVLVAAKKLPASSGEAGKLSAFLRVVEDQDKSAALLEAKPIHQDQSNFELVDKQPWLYWVGDSVFALFRELSPLDDGGTEPIAMPRRGLEVPSVARFIRYFWETLDSPHWVIYFKGGDARRWYGNREYVVNWAGNGALLRAAPGGSLTNQRHYFRAGLTFNRTAVATLSVRFMPETAIMGGDGPGIFSDRYSLEYLAGFLNSRLVAFLIQLINPTLHYQTGDVARIPFRHPDPETKSVVETLVQDCMKVGREIHVVSLTEPVFDHPALAGTAPTAAHTTLSAAHKAHRDRIESLEARVLLNEAAIDQHIFDLYKVTGDDLAQVLFEQGRSSASYPLLSGHDTIACDLIPQARLHFDTLPRMTLTHEDLAALKERLEPLYVEEGQSIEEISAALEINPISVVALRRELDLINPDDLKHEVENLLTHLIWELGKRDEDGIIPYDDGLQNPSLLHQVRGEIEALFGPDRALAIEAEMDTILGRGGLARWLGDPFFRKHVRQFKKRPILWQITSPAKHFRLFLYYHKLDNDTLPKVRSQYLWPLLERARTRLRAAQALDPPDLRAIANLETYIADLEECDRRLEQVIQGTVDVDLPDWASGPYRGGRAPYHPDLDDGVKTNILPLQAAGLPPMRRVV